MTSSQLPIVAALRQWGRANPRGLRVSRKHPESWTSRTCRMSSEKHALRGSSNCSPYVGRGRAPFTCPRRDPSTACYDASGCPSPSAKAAASFLVGSTGGDNRSQQLTQGFPTNSPGANQRVEKALADVRAFSSGLRGKDRARRRGAVPLRLEVSKRNLPRLAPLSNGQLS